MGIEDDFLKKHVLESPTQKAVEKRLSEEGDRFLESLGLVKAYEKLVAYSQSMPESSQLANRLQEIRNGSEGEGRPTLAEVESNYLKGKSRLLSSELLLLMAHIKQIEMRRIMATEDSLAQQAEKGPEDKK